MRDDVICMLQCPACGAADLKHLTFSHYSETEIGDAVVWCEGCTNWYPIQDGLLDLLTGALVYAGERKDFWERYSGPLQELGLSPDPAVDPRSKDLQLIQQSHFDWYASNELQNYVEYARQPFWLAADSLAFEPWRKDILPGSWLLDVGCAEGRSTFKVMDLDINIIGFDVSRALVRQAITRYRSGSSRARAAFCLADASNFPFRSASFDYVLIYGVLHHLPDPAAACKEVARVLKLNGKYFGSENNRSGFRAIFDQLQRLRPIWHEEAGPQALFSSDEFNRAFSDTGMQIRTHTGVFLPPHLFNLFTPQRASRLLAATDSIGRAIPALRDHGGLIFINGVKSTEGRNGIL